PPIAVFAYFGQGARWIFIHVTKFCVCVFQRYFVDVGQPGQIMVMLMYLHSTTGCNAAGRNQQKLKSAVVALFRNKEGISKSKGIIVFCVEINLVDLASPELDHFFLFRERISE